MRHFLPTTILGVALGGCATITSGTSQTIEVTTYPAGAACEGTRDGAPVGSVAATPGTFTVDKAPKTLTVTCRRDGYQSAVKRLSAVAQPMTFGNVIAGGVIGVAVDAASGAMTVYEDLPMLIMTPVSFTSEQARDDFFKRAAEEIRRAAGTDIVKARETQAVCGARQYQVACATVLKVRADRRDAELADLEQQRQRARIDGR
jgi:hypothetical protein